jgi:glycosyltransferase involved in cell wall biosynthesis
MMQIIALLGRPDAPTDGVQDYCEHLGSALAGHGAELTIARVDWFRQGWVGALVKLWQSASQWRGKWVILQYTALSWSRHGFPVGLLLVAAVLRRNGARCGIFYHEPYHQEGSGLLRGRCQSYVIRKMYFHTDKSIFPAPLETIAWLPIRDRRASFIPIGANIPTHEATPMNLEHSSKIKTIAVFCLSGAPNVFLELEDISEAARSAVAAGLDVRFLFLGRGTSEARARVEDSFREIPVGIAFLGLLQPNEIERVLAQSDLMLCVRGAITPRRGSAIAGIACGLPIVGYKGLGTCFPITEAGTRLVTYRDKYALANALCEVIADDRIRQELRARSRRAHEEYFSWDKIAERFVTELSTD